MTAIFTDRRRRLNCQAALLALVLILGWALQANAAYVVKQSWVRTSATAGETLAVGNVACIKDADGYAYKADADVSTLRPSIGIVTKGGASGDKVEITVCGIVSGWTGLSEGQTGYLSGTAGAVTQTMPAFGQPVGVALTATTYFFSFRGDYLSSGTLTTAMSYEALTSDSAGVAASLTVMTTLITTDGGEDLNEVTLADGLAAGQIKIFTISAEGAAADTVKITPENLNGGTQITFDGTVGDGCIMIFDGTAWNIVANNGGTIA